MQSVESLQPQAADKPQICHAFDCVAMQVAQRDLTDSCTDTMLTTVALLTQHVPIALALN